ncbi:MAG TPA: hypothetical protein VLO10_06570 [Candidatus Deferrimicrobium sp.]|nr:hypothetical protein [Candidatus Deferrimicrobium sp.]
MTATPVAPKPTIRSISRRGLVIFLVAAVAVVIAAVVGFRGLAASPIQSVGPDGTATLHGTWEPYSCDANACEGYVQAGARSVFIVLPARCAHPQRAADITVTGRLDATLGTGSYRATACAT